MTDKETLISYRLRQAQETLGDARLLLDQKASPRSVVNRAYYSMFYAVLALFLHADVRIRTSKHSGVISIFDREFVHSDKIEKRFSAILHLAFEARQNADYKEMVELFHEDAAKYLQYAADFLNHIEGIIAAK